MLDVLQLSAIGALQRPDLVEAVAARGLAVVVNSPVRGISRMANTEATPEEVVCKLLAMTGVATVLTGTRTHLADMFSYAAVE